MDQFSQYGTYQGQYYGGPPFNNDPMMMAQEQKKAEKHGLFVATAKLGALLILYELLTTAFGYAYYYILYYVKSGSFTFSFDEIRKYFSKHREFANSSFVTMLGNLSIVLVSMGILIAVATLLLKVDLRPMLKPSKEKALGGAKWFTLSMSVNIAVSIVVSIIVSILSTAGLTVPEQDFSLTDNSTGALVMQFLYVIVLGPLCEELFYRGLIISLLKPYGKGLAVFFSAFLFGYMHGNIPQFASAFAGGLVFAAIAVKYDSIVPTIVMHMLNNTVASIGDFTDVLNVSDAISDNLYYSVVIICGIAGMYMLFVYLNEIKPKEERTFLLTSGERTRAVFLNVVMIIYLGYQFMTYVNSFISNNR